MKRGTRGNQLIQLVLAAKKETGHLNNDDKLPSSSKCVVSLPVSDNEGHSSLNKNLQCQRQESPLTLEQLAVAEEIESAIDWDPKTPNENVLSEDSCDDSVADPDYTLSDSLGMSSDEQSLQTLSPLPASVLPPIPTDSLLKEPSQQTPKLIPTQPLAQSSSPLLASILPTMPSDSPAGEPSLQPSNLSPTELLAQSSSPLLASTLPTMPSDSPPGESSLQIPNLPPTQLFAQPSSPLLASTLPPMPSDSPPGEPSLQPSNLSPTELLAQSSSPLPASVLPPIPTDSLLKEPSQQTPKLIPTQPLAQSSSPLLASILPTMPSDSPAGEPSLQIPNLPPTQLFAQSSSPLLASTLPPMPSDSPPGEPSLQPSNLSPTELLAQSSSPLLASTLPTMPSDSPPGEPSLQPSNLSPTELLAQSSSPLLASTLPTMPSDSPPGESSLQIPNLPPTQLFAQSSSPLLASTLPPMPSDSPPGEPSLQPSNLSPTELLAQSSSPLLASTLPTMPSDSPPGEPSLQPSNLSPTELLAQSSSPLLASTLPTMPSDSPPGESSLQIPNLPPTQLFAQSSSPLLASTLPPMPSDCPPGEPSLQLSNLSPTQIHGQPSPSNLTFSSITLPSESPPEEASPLPAPNSVNNTPHDDTTTTPKRRKRKVEELWKRNVQKKNRNSGAEYLDCKGNLKAARHPQNIGNPCSCKQKCHDILNDQDKQCIFDAFWNLKDLDRQRDFLANNVTEIETKNPRVKNSRRKYTLTYNFTHDSIKRQVCKKFFLETLNVTDKMVRTALNKRRRGTGDIVSPDKRGRHPPGIKLSEESLNHANSHIDSFPAVPSHWCRKDSKKIYLEPILNKEKMYGLYLEKCTEDNVKPISKTSYRELLIKKNIGFYIPRKDQCWCHRFELLPEDEKLQKQNEYDLHQRRKLNAYKQKEEDAKKAKCDSTYLCGNFDLEAVLYSPLIHAKPVFYKRKLATYNFTLYEVATKQGHCFMWTEYEGNRGSNEVSTCLYKFIKDIPITVSHLVLYADCCPGQNRNSILVSMFLAAIAAEDCCLDTIDLKFLEPGHTYMECDSMHATIEIASESAKIFIPDDWENVVKLARKNKPFKITTLRHTDFIDFKAIRESQLPDKIISQDGTQLYWTQVKWLRFTKQSLDTFYFKLEYWDEEFKKVIIVQKTRTRRSAIDDTASPTLPQAYNSQIPIKAIKYKDLQELCKSGLIPSTYHPYFKDLPAIMPAPTQKKKSQKNKPIPDDSDEIALAASKASYIKRRRV